MESVIRNEAKQKIAAIVMSLSHFFLTFSLYHRNGLKNCPSTFLFIHNLLLGDVTDHFPAGNLVFCEAIYAAHLICLLSFKKIYTGILLKIILIADFLISITVMILLFLAFCIIHSMNSFQL